MSNAHHPQKNIADDVFDPVTPEGDDPPLTPEQEAELLAMDGLAPPTPASARWAPLAAALREGLEDAAERAKPDLAQVSGEVFRRLEQKKVQVPEETGFFAGLLALLARFQPHLALAAATAAIVFAILPLASDTPATQGGTDPVAALPVEPGPDGAPQVAAVQVESPTTVELRHIAFDNSDGIVFHDTESDSTVIWVNEYDGA